MKEGTV